MSAFEDYDEFGNYIGADLDSDEEEEVPQETFTRQAQAPLEGFDDEPMEGAEDNALMEIDGASGCGTLNEDFIQYSPLQNQHITLSFCTKTNNTILVPRTYTVKTWRRWYRRKMRNHCPSPLLPL